MLPLDGNRIAEAARRFLRRAGILSYLPEDAELRHNARQSLLDGMAYSVMPGFFNPFVSVFAIALGATNYMVGLLASLPALTGILGQAVGAYMANRSPRRLPVVLWWAFFNRIFFLLFALLPFLPVPRAWVFIAGVIIMNLPGSAAGLAWTSLMGKIFPPETRGQLFGERNAITGAVTIASTAVGGLLLAAIKFPYNYTFLNLVSFVFLMVSLYFLSTLHEKPSGDPDGTGSRAARGGKGMVAVAKQMYENRPYVTFVASMIVLQFGMAMPAAVYPILLVRMLHFSTAWIGAMATAGGLSSVLMYRFWGRFADRHGHRRTLTISTLVFPLGSLAYVFVHAPYTPSFIEFVFGMFAAGFNLSVFNYVLELAPPESSPTYIAAYNIATSLVVLVAPLVGVYVLTIASAHAALVAASVARLAGVTLLWVTGSGTPVGWRPRPAHTAAAR